MVTVSLSLGRKIASISCSSLLTAYFNIYELPVFYKHRSLVLVTVMVCYSYASKFRRRILSAYGMWVNQKDSLLLFHWEQTSESCGSVAVPASCGLLVSLGSREIGGKGLAWELSLQPGRMLKKQGFLFSFDFLPQNKESCCGNNSITWLGDGSWYSCGAPFFKRS